MCKSSAPVVQPQPPAPPQYQDPAVQEARRKKAAEAKRGQGFSTSLLTQRPRVAAGVSLLGGGATLAAGGGQRR